MSEKPGKRVVGWKQYLKAKSNKGIGYTGVAAYYCAGSALLFVALFWIWLGLFGSRDELEFRVISVVVGGGVFGLISFLLFRRGTEWFKFIRQLEPVALITKHNTGQLPEVETLVRASALPPSHQQAELLRSAGPSQEAPAEELLRATSGRDQEG